MQEIYNTCPNVKKKKVENVSKCIKTNTKGRISTLQRKPILLLCTDMEGQLKSIPTFPSGF